MDNIEDAPSKVSNGENSILKKIPNIESTSTIQIIIIIVLTVFLILATLGINVFTAIGKIFESAFDVIKPVTYNIISDIEFTSGSVINDTSNLLSDTTKRGVDILNGTIQDIGGLLVKSSGKEKKKEGYSIIELQPTYESSYSSSFAKIDGDKYKTNTIYDPTMFSSFE
jgi:hypothetical protein